MKTLSLDLRERIVASYDAGACTRQDLARRYRVSLGMVKKLLQPRQKTKELLGRQPDMTLEELRVALTLDCTVQALFYVLADMNLTYKKRRSGPASRTARTSRRRGANGRRCARPWTRPASSSWTNRGRKRT